MDDISDKINAYIDASTEAMRAIELALRFHGLTIRSSGPLHSGAVCLNQVS